MHKYHCSMSSVHRFLLSLGHEQYMFGTVRQDPGAWQLDRNSRPLMRQGQQQLISSPVMHQPIGGMWRLGQPVVVYCQAVRWRIPTTGQTRLQLWFLIPGERYPIYGWMHSSPRLWNSAGSSVPCMWECMLKIAAAPITSTSTVANPHPGMGHVRMVIFKLSNQCLNSNFNSEVKVKIQTWINIL